jgi:hypothetical protein
LQDPDHRLIEFPQVLRAYNGYDPGSTWIDLHPLMELRIENAYYQEGARRKGLQGYLGTEVAEYEVLKQGLKLLSLVSMHGRPHDQQPVQDLISPPEMEFKYYRLYYEIFFGHAHESHGSVLLGVNSIEEMTHLTAGLSTPERICYPGAAHCTVFPEACSVSVEMRIFVNGRPQNVVWGTPLRDVVPNPHHLSILRLYKRRAVPVQVSPSDPKALLLPLLPGDRIDWTEAR